MSKEKNTKKDLDSTCAAEPVVEQSLITVLVSRDSHRHYSKISTRSRYCIFNWGIVLDTARADPQRFGLLFPQIPSTAPNLAGFGHPANLRHTDS